MQSSQKIFELEANNSLLRFCLALPQNIKDTLPSLVSEEELSAMNTIEKIILSENLRLELKNSEEVKNCEELDFAESIIQIFGSAEDERRFLEIYKKIEGKRISSLLCRNALESFHL